MGGADDSASGEIRQPYAGIVLAAGAARRMGRLKQLLPLGERSVLEHVLRALVASCLGEFVVVLGCGAGEIRRHVRVPRGAPVRFVVNPDYQQGQSTSLRAGLDAISCSAEAVAVVLGDQPSLRPSVIDRVAAAFARSDRPAARALYRDRSGAAVPAHPVFLARCLWPAARDLCGDQGARALFARDPKLLLPVPVQGRVPPDLDTLDDYRALRAVWSRRRPS